MLDTGCAIGFLVEALRDRGVDARGFDNRAQALLQVRDASALGRSRVAFIVCLGSLLFRLCSGGLGSLGAALKSF